MAIDKNNLPPPLQALLNDLEKMGIKPTIVDGDELAKIAAAQDRQTSETSSADSTEKPCDCPACTLRKTLEARLEKSGPSAALGALPPNILGVLDRQAAKVAAALTDQVKKMVEPLRVELKRQVEINDNNMARIADLHEQLGKGSYGRDELGKLFVSNSKKLEGLEDQFLKQARDTGDQIEYYRHLFVDLNARHVNLAARHNDLEARFSDLEERYRKQIGLLHKRVTKRKGEVQDVKVRVATTRGRVTRVEKKLT